MARYLILITICFLYSCNDADDSKSLSRNELIKPGVVDTSWSEYALFAKFSAFDTTISVVFTDAEAALTPTQKANYDGFLAKQDQLSPEILKAIFDYYKRVYAEYKNIWKKSSNIGDTDLQKHLPTPSTPEDLKSFITPGAIFVQNAANCKEGTLGFDFDCTWDKENGVGVLVENWRVSKVSTRGFIYFE